MTKWLVSAFLLTAFWVPGARAQTIMAASCNNTSGNTAVQNAINSATAGQTVTIPSGTCAWTVPVSIGSLGITLQCQAGTVIQDNVPNGSGPELVWAAIPESALPRITGCDWEPFSGNSVSQFMSISGTCNSSGCTQFRFDHNLWGAGTCWPGPAGGTPLWTIDNAFGVLDHNGSSSQPMCMTPGGGAQIFNFQLSSYQGIGANGDNSWAQPDTFGGANAIYFEDNYVVSGGASGKIFFNDCDGDACRLVVRFNTFVNSNFGGHGTESPGRERGERQFETYGNTFENSDTCSVSPYVIQLLRSGTAIYWGNTFAASGSCTPSFTAFATLNEFRSFGGNNSGPFRFWGNCGMCNPFDTNDGQQTVITGTITAVSGNVVTDSSKSWTTNQFKPTTGGVACQFEDNANANSGSPIAGVLSNTTNSATLGGGYNAATMNVGDPYWISCAKAYVAGASTGGGSNTIADTTQSWTTNQWFTNGAPYTMWDITQGASNEIASNTSNTLTGNGTCNNFSCATFGAGHIYVITRATQCLDQPAAGVLAGNTSVVYISGTPILPVGSVHESISPVYEFMDTLQSGVTWNSAVGSASAREIANRDFFSESTNQPAQTSPSSPFDGTSGNGHGTLANRPITCSQGVGYWATDQGTWNQSGSGGQGQLSVCTATNTWSPYYTPYTYPHPLTTGSLPPPPAAPLGVTVTSVQ